MRLINTAKTDAERIEVLLGELASQISNALGNASERATDVPGLSIYRCCAPTAPNACSYEPSLLIVPQGKKRVDVGKTNYVFGQSRFLLTSIELPIISQVVTASQQKPYLAFFLRLDMPTVRDILNAEDILGPRMSSGKLGMGLGVTTAELVSSCSRMIDLLGTPQDIPFLGKLMQREIIYRLLQGTQGDRLRAIATVGDKSQRTAKAVAWLAANFEKSLHVEQLARLAGMGLSTLHSHFRALTGMSPLQYQKQLRLRAARQRMLLDEMDAATAAFDVGYESASQFNREYRRFFGKPPMRDVHALRIAGEAARSAEYSTP